MYRRKIELHNVDCLPFMKQCEDKQFDLAIVDPPYGIEINKQSQGKGGGVAKKIECPEICVSLPFFRCPVATVNFGFNNELQTRPTLSRAEKSHSKGFSQLGGKTN